MNIFFRSIFVFIFFLTPIFAIAEVTSAGIPKDLIWFSKSSLYAGDTVNVYTVVYNSTPYQLAGTMELRDSRRVLGKQEFTVGPSGASEVVVIPWKVTSGNHNLRMFVTNGVFTFNGKTIANVGVTHVQSGQIELFTELPSVADPQVSVAPIMASSGGKSASSSLISSIDVQVVEHVPQAIISTAVPVLGHLEQFRITQAASVSGVIHDAENAINAAARTEAGVMSTSIASRLDKWGGVISPETNGTATPRTKSQIKGWDLLIHGASDTDIVRTPLQYVKLFFALILSFIISHAIVFYIVLLLLIYKTVRILLGIFF